jgi:hypothetical protein
MFERRMNLNEAMMPSNERGKDVERGLLGIEGGYPGAGSS